MKMGIYEVIFFILSRMIFAKIQSILKGTLSCLAYDKLLA